MKLNDFDIDNLNITYYECHINLAPESDRDLLTKIALDQNFRLAKLYMGKGSGELATDCFMTGRSQVLEDLKNRTEKTLQKLQDNNVNFFRVKFEAVIYDQRL